MNPLQVIARSVTRPLQRSFVPISMSDWNDMFSLDGTPLLHTTMSPNQEGEVTSEFVNLIGGAYARNGVIFACMLARLSLFSEARFLWQQLRDGVPANLFSTPELAILEHPEPNKTTGDLLARASVDLDLAGNWYGVRRGNRIKRLRPDWVTILVGSPNPNRDLNSWDPDAEVVGYFYQPGGTGSGQDPMTFAASEVAHFAMVPDPFFQYRGMSWLIPILREMQADTAATAHKLAFFRNAATPNLSISLPSTMTVEKARSWIELFEQEHRGVSNAYRSMYFGGGATAEIIGANFQQMDFRGLQSGFETRIASAAGMHPVIVPFSEGLTGSSLNAGNFQQAARLVGDKTLRPMWRNFAGSLEPILVKPNPATRLWYDEKDIAFLRTDVKDEAEIEQRRAATVNTYITAGFKPETVISAISSGYDLSQLQHTGLYSVQLQPPQSSTPQLDTTPQTVPQAAGRGLVPVNCSNCDRVIGEADGAVRLRCKRCGTYTETRVGGENDGNEMRTALLSFLTREQKAPEVRIESPITVNPPAVTISEGALRVDSPITVHPSPVNINEGAIRVEAPPAANVTVHPPDVHVPVTIADGAIHVQTPDVQVPVNVDINEGAVQVTMPEQPPNTVTIEQGAISPTVQLPESLELKSDILQEELVQRLEQALSPRKRRIERDANGRIIRLVDELEDAG
jgi:hypothetical protein